MAQSAIQAARADPDVNNYAPADLDAAQTQWESANQAWGSGAGRDEAAHRADLAIQQVEIARANAEARRAEAQITSLGEQHDKVMRQSAEAEVRSLQQQLADLQAQQTERGIVLTMGDVLFDTGQATIKPGAVDEITRLAVFLEENPNRAVRIEGHTDSTGSMSTNMVLSQRRADTVTDVLASAGIPRSRVTAVGYGPDAPVATNATAVGRQQNRRVEIVIENAPATGPASARAAY
jgi:outer membrane protein OmpA-like peptidoglycan-associated protein